MASGFPGSIDSFTNPLTTSALNSPSHAGQHQDLNDAVNKIETYMGLVKVIPTSVSSAGGTSATLAANGTVTIGSGNTQITINGAFSALYDSYKILVTGGTYSTTCDLGMRLGAAITNYRYQFIYGNLATTLSTDGSVGSDRFPYCGITGGTQMLADIQVIGPFNAASTMIHCHGGRIGNYLGTFTGGQTDTTSFTSVTFLPSAGTMTGGTIRVYGYRN